MNRKRIKLLWIIYVVIILVQFAFYYFARLETYPAIIFPAFAYAGTPETIEVPNYIMIVNFENGDTQQLPFKTLFKTLDWSDRDTIFWILTEDASFADSIPKSRVIGLLSDIRFIGQQKSSKQQQEINEWLQQILETKTQQQNIRSVTLAEQQTVYDKSTPPQYQKTVLLKKKTIYFNQNEENKQ